MASESIDIKLCQNDSKVAGIPRVGLVGINNYKFGS